MVSWVFVGFPTITPIILWWILVVLLCFLSALDDVIHVSSIPSFFLQWLRRLYGKGQILFLKKLVTQPDRWKTKGTFTRKHNPFSKVLRFQSRIQFFHYELTVPLSQSLLKALWDACHSFLCFFISVFLPFLLLVLLIFLLTLSSSSSVLSGCLHPSFLPFSLPYSSSF